MLSGAGFHPLGKDPLSERVKKGRTRMSKAKLIFAALVLLATGFVAAPTPPAQALLNPCDKCGAECQVDYQPGWNDCGGPPRGCLRITVCG